MNAVTAASILMVAQKGGYYEGDLPDDEDKLIEEAEFFLGHAKAAADAGAADEVCQKIIELGDESVKDDGYVPLPEGKPEVTEDNLPLPREVAEDPPEMPYDISTCKDKDVRRLASKFNACFNFARRKVTLIETQALRARQLQEAAFREAYVAEEQAAREAGIKPFKKDLELAARLSPKYKELEDQAFELEAKAREYKALMEIYKGNVSLLSREISAREYEWRRTGGHK